MSNNIVNKILTSSESEQLQKNFEAASEVTAKMDKSLYASFRNLVNHFQNSYAEMKRVIANISHRLEIAINETIGYYDDMENAFEKKKRIYRFQIFSMEKNFLRAFEAMEERTLTNVAGSSTEFGLNVERRILRLVNDKDAENDTRSAMYGLLLDSLQTRQDLCNLAAENISVFISAYANGTPIFSYQFENVSRIHNRFIVPKPLLNLSLHYNEYMDEHLPVFHREALDRLNNSLETLKDFASDAFYLRSVDHIELAEAVKRFFSGCNNFRYSKSVVYSTGITLPVRVLEGRMADFISNWDDFVSEIREMKQNMASLRSSIENLTINILPAFDDIADNLDTYLPEGNATKSGFAKLLLSNDINIYINTIRDFFREVHTRGQLINDILSLLTKPLLSMWKMIIDDTDSKEYYIFTKNFLFLQNFTDVADDLSKKLTHLKSEDIRSCILHKDDDFFSALTDLTTHLESFNKSMVIDSNFVT